MGSASLDRAGRALWRYGTRRYFHPRYDADGVISQHDLAHAVGPNPGRNDYRHYVAMQLATRASKMTGAAFVSLGVAHGRAAHRILEAVKPSNPFWLVDSWDGRRSAAEASFKDSYTGDFDTVRASFATYPNVHFLRGIVPDVIDQLPEQPIAFAHFNLGDPASEIEALRLLADRVAAGGSILIDAFGRGVSTDDQRSGYLDAAGPLVPFALQNGQLILFG